MAKATQKENSVKAVITKAGTTIPVIKDVANKVWVLTVVGALWASAYVIYMCTASNVPHKITAVLAAALFVLGLMFLFVNLRSVKSTVVLE